MKIASIDSYLVAIPYEHGAPKPVLTAASGRQTQDAVYVRVETENGLTGWGEAFGFGACQMSHLAIGHVVAPLATGRDASDIPALMTSLFRATQGMSRNGPVAYALSGLDIALWDIAGKAAGKPVHAMLGGARRSRIPAYASLLRIGDPEYVAKVTRIALSRGYRHIKLHERTAEAVAAARAAAGPDIALMLDTNCTWDTETALAMCQKLRPYNLAWLEEPVYPPDDFAGLARLRKEGGIPVAAGENLGNVMDVRHCLEMGAVDVIQPDLAKMGGITEMMKAISLASAAGVRLELHSPLFGPALAASQHVLAAIPEETMCEFYFADLEANPMGAAGAPRDGFFDVPQGPGLGIEVDEKLLQSYAIA
ncbi:MAG: mandelate racemase/muconate lactonizing enzyme family protein [Beijerinckiaceae bacterium]